MPDELTIEEVAKRIGAWRNAVNAQRGDDTAQPIPPPTMPRYVTIAGTRYDTTDRIEASIITRVLRTGEMPVTLGSPGFERLVKAQEKRDARAAKRLSPLTLISPTQHDEYVQNGVKIPGVTP